ncbi:MAG TPA: DUF1830 domain-containing protein [Leptolyngbyaceae cyanobacterium M65_K2018_010]|nr:DUF1830 domain-containing protein [Leptolyngbyaceae cyanobacterium M65_K2018_010]
MQTQTSTESLNCFYVNATSLIQVVRVVSESTWLSERVLSPGHRFLFKAPADATLEVYTGELATGVLADRIPCRQLACSDQDLIRFSATDPVILRG